MQYSFDGHGSSRELLRAKAEAANLSGQLDGDPSHKKEPRASENPRADDACDWHGDAPEPELDDLAQECEKNQQPSRPAEVCEWRGDEPERQDDKLDRICESENQAQQPEESDEPVEPTDSIQSPVPEHNATHVHEDEAGPSTRKGKQPEKEKEMTEQPETPAAAEPAAENDSATEGKPHSPWVDSLAQMPPIVAEKVNMGLKQAMEAAAGVLKHQKSPEAAAEESRKNSSAATNPSGSQTPRATEPAKNVSDKQKEREKKRAEKAARRQAKRKASQEKREERRQKRREKKEKAQKEKARKKAERHGGGDLPRHLLEGLQHTLDSTVSYHTRCEICATSALPSKNRNPQCTICAKAAEREATNEYLKSSKITLANLPTVSHLYEAVGNFLGKGKQPEESAAERSRQENEDLICHIALHVRDLATAHGEPSSSRRHKCDDGARCDRSGSHGLDRNRDSPTVTDEGRMVSHCPQNLSLTTIPKPPGVDWWVQAVCSEDPSPPLYRPSSPPSVALSPKVTTISHSRLFPRAGGKTTVYGPRTFRYSLPSAYSVPSRLDLSRAAYHFYLPFSVCHNHCYSPDSSGPSNWQGPQFPPGSTPAFPDENQSQQDIPGWPLGRAETLHSETLPLLQDEICHRRSRSGSI